MKYWLNAFPLYCTIAHIEVKRPRLSDIGKFIIHVLFKWSIMVRILRIYNAQMTLIKKKTLFAYPHILKMSIVYVLIKIPIFLLLNYI